MHTVYFTNTVSNDISNTQLVLNWSTLMLFSDSMPLKCFDSVYVSDAALIKEEMHHWGYGLRICSDMTLTEWFNNKLFFPHTPAQCPYILGKHALKYAGIK